MRWLLLCAVFVGLGFNIKMLEAYLVVPAYGRLYLLAAPRRIWVRIGHLALAALLMLTISLSSPCRLSDLGVHGDAHHENFPIFLQYASHDFPLLLN